MTFKPGDQVLIDGKGPFTVEPSGSSSYPLRVVGDTTYTTDGRITKDSPVSFTLFLPPSVTSYPLGKVQTLDDGTKIYHPNEGQPFQLIPTTKAFL